MLEAVSLEVEVELGRDDSLGIEAWLGSTHLAERFEEQSRHHEQERCECDLGDDEGGAELRPVLRPDAGAAARLPGRHDAKKQCREQSGKRRKGQDASIERRVEMLDPLEQTDQEASTNESEGQPSRHSCCGDQERLDHELPEDVSAVGAQRSPQGNLTAPIVGASETQVADVGTGDQEDQSHERREYGDHGRSLACVVWLQVDACEARQKAVFVGLGEFLRERLAERFDLGAGAVVRRVVPEPAERKHPECVATVEEGEGARSQRLLHHHRSKQILTVEAIDSSESLLGDADDREL